MQLRYRQQVTTAGVAVVALTLTLGACSSSSSSSAAAGGSSSSGSVSSSGGSANLSGTLNGSGSTLQLVYEQAAIAAFKSVQSGMTVNYGGGGSGKGRTDLASGTVKFAGSDSPIPDKETVELQGQDRALLPDPDRPDHGLVQSVRPQQAVAAVGADHREHLLGQDHELERLGDQGGQPRRDPAQHLVIIAVRSDSSGTTANFSQFLVEAGGSAWTLGSSSIIKLALHRPGRQRQRRGGADHQVHPRGHRVRGLRQRQGLHADLRFGQEQGRQATWRHRWSRPPPPPTTPPSSPT